MRRAHWPIPPTRSSARPRPRGARAVHIGQPPATYLPTHPQGARAVHIVDIVINITQLLRLDYNDK